MNQITEKAQLVLDAIAKGDNTRASIAKTLDVTIPVVSGSISALKRQGYVNEMDDGHLTASKSGSKNRSNVEVDEHREGSKMAAAAEIFSKHFEKEPRAAIIERFMEDVGLTKAGASTYYQSLRRDVGAGTVAYQRRRKASLSRVSARSNRR